MGYIARPSLKEAKQTKVKGSTFVSLTLLSHGGIIVKSIQVYLNVALSLPHKSSFVEVRLGNPVSLLLEDMRAQHACGAVWIEGEALGFHELKLSTTVCCRICLESCFSLYQLIPASYLVAEVYLLNHLQMELKRVFSV